MVKRLLYSYVLGGEEIIDFVLPESRVHLTRDYTTCDTAEIRISSDVEDTVVPTKGQTIVVSRGELVATEKKKFRGTVNLITKQGNVYILSCNQKMDDLNYMRFTKSYDIDIDPEEGELSAIFKDIAEDGGFTVSTQDSGKAVGDVRSKQFVSRGNTRMNKLALIARILNWIIREDYADDELVFEPKGYLLYPTTLTVGSNVHNVPKWEDNLHNMRNKLTIKGAYELDTRTESETGDGSTTEFDFTYTPESTECEVNSSLQRRGVENGSGTYDYYVDTENKKYVFVTAPTNLHTIEMKYTTKIARNVTGSDAGSITRWDKTKEDEFTFKDLTTIDDAETRLTQLLDLLKNGETKTRLITDEYDLEVGNKVPVVDSTSSEYSGEYIVFEIILNYPEVVDTVIIGNEKISLSDITQSIEERLAELEQESGGSVELLRHSIPLRKTINLIKETLVKTRYKICDSFISDHYVNSLVDTGAVLQEFDDYTDWSVNTGDVTLSNESTIVLNGGTSLKIICNDYTQTIRIDSAESLGDISAYTGAASGAPIQGTVGLWLYVTTATDINTVRLRLGTSASVYYAYQATAYASVDGYDNFDSKTFTLQAGWNYILFDLTDELLHSGTPNWTVADYCRIHIAATANATFYLGYMTVGNGSNIGLNGVGYRVMEMST